MQATEIATEDLLKTAARKVITDAEAVKIEV